MYVVLEDSAEITVEVKTLEMAGPGALVGEMALIDASARSATALAKEDCKLAPDGHHKPGLIQAHRKTGRPFSGHSADGIRGMAGHLLIYQQLREADLPDSRADMNRRAIGSILT